jgi:hypothetical protein
MEKKEGRIGKEEWKEQEGRNKENVDEGEEEEEIK